MNGKRIAIRTLLVATYLPAAPITPAAYGYLTAGVLGGIEIAPEGRGFIGICLSAVSLLALFSLWRVWSIAKRLWIHSEYVPPPEGGRLKDGVGIAAGWIALAGIVALIRVDDLQWLGLVAMCSAFVLPAALVATVAFILSLRRDPANALQA
ncbi:MAG TPA: hypothetical protein VGD45_14160 [Steroidobacter sp.]|uniref:hypothetical protein n=1 Tax=Steroidobacter sp. TaxID=1978227 RepID=UPI002ED83FAB